MMDAIHEAQIEDQSPESKARVAAAGAVGEALASDMDMTPAAFRTALDSLDAYTGLRDVPRPEDGVLQKLSDGRIDEVRAQLEAVRPLEPCAAWSTDAPPPRQWLVDNRIPFGRFGLLSGSGGAGKSRLALGLAVAVAGQGEGAIPQWLTWDVADLGPVIWCSWEDEPDEVARRLGAPGRAVVDGRLHYVDASERGPVWAPKGNGHILNAAQLTPFGARVRRLCEKQKAKLLVLDPLAAAYGNDENARPLVRAFVSSWDGWARRTRCTVMVISHPSRATAGRKGDDDGTSGSTDWANASRFVISMRSTDPNRDGRHKDGLKVLEWTQANYGKRPAGVFVKWTACGWQHDGPYQPNTKPKETERKRGKAAHGGHQEGVGYDRTA